MGAPWGWSIPTWAPLSWEDNGHWDHRGHLLRCRIPPTTPLLQGAPPYPRNSSYMEQAALLPPILPIHSQPAFLNEEQTPQSLPMHPNPWGWLSSFPSAVVPRWHPCVGDVPHPWLRFFLPPHPPPQYRSVPRSNGRRTPRRSPNHLQPKPNSSRSLGCCRGMCRSCWRAATTRTSWAPSCTRQVGLEGRGWGQRGGMGSRGLLGCDPRLRSWRWLGGHSIGESLMGLEDTSIHLRRGLPLVSCWSTGAPLAFLASREHCWVVVDHRSTVGQPGCYWP